MALKGVGGGGAPNPSLLEASSTLNESLLFIRRRSGLLIKNHVYNAPTLSIRFISPRPSIGLSAVGRTMFGPGRHSTSKIVIFRAALPWRIWDGFESPKPRKKATPARLHRFGVHRFWPTGCCLDLVANPNINILRSCIFGSGANWGEKPIKARQIGFARARAVAQKGSFHWNISSFI